MLYELCKCVFVCVRVYCVNLLRKTWPNRRQFSVQQFHFGTVAIATVGMQFVLSTIYCTTIIEEKENYTLRSVFIALFVRSTCTHIQIYSLHFVVIPINFRPWRIQKLFKSFIHEDRIESNRIGNWISIYFRKSFDLFSRFTSNDMIYTFFLNSSVPTYERASKYIKRCDCITLKLFLLLIN